MHRYLVGIFIVALAAGVLVEARGRQASETERTQQALTALLREYCEALKRNDLVALNQMFADDYVEVSATAAVMSKEQVMNLYKMRQAQSGSGVDVLAIDADEINIRSYGDSAVILARLTWKLSANGQSLTNPLRISLLCNKQHGQWRLVATHQSSLRPATATPVVQNQSLSTFDVLPVPEKVKQFAWVKLAEDPADDGRRKTSADGKAFHYFYDQPADMLWFRLDLYNAINTETPAVSVSIDMDADQSNGVNWYGSNRQFKLEKMLSVGPLQRQGEKYSGYNGITDEQGIRTQNWINVKKGVITFYYDSVGNAYYLGVKRTDIDANLRRVNVIGSVGANALWNDDIGDAGYATIELNIAK